MIDTADKGGGRVVLSRIKGLSLDSQGKRLFEGMRQVTNRLVFLLGKQEMRSFAKQERKRQAVSWGNGDENRMIQKQ